ncbi:MAG: helix-turn-helix transcriptional regulator [Betaproteobacteria bacterium]|nr:helix-turn-helix transcriptional regulator [Betaproteobacteria bacterium]
MDFAQRLAALRKERGLTQQALADRVAVHLTQINRYETGDSQPMLDVIRRLAIALSVTTDELIFDKDERGPEEDMRLQFETISQFDEEDKELARGLLEGLILKHQAKQSVARQAARAAPQASKGKATAKRVTARA